MNIKKLIVIFIANLFIYQPLSASETCDTVTKEDVSQFIEDHTSDWQIFFAAIPFFYPNMGKIEFEKGSPIKVYTITPESFQNYASQGSFKSTLISKNTWYIPISSNVPTYNLLKIHCSDDELKITGTAGTRIAEQLNEVYRQLEEQLNLGEVSRLIIKINTTKRIMLVLERDNDSTVYPLIEFPNQYSSLQSVNNLNGYSASEILLLIAAEFLNTANLATLTSEPELQIIIPKTAYIPPTASGATDMFWIKLEYLPNDEDKLLFEVNEYHSIQ